MLMRLNGYRQEEKTAFDHYCRCQETQKQEK